MSGLRHDTLNWDDVSTYEAELAAELPRFDVRYKDESSLQKLIAVVLRPFNGKYLTNYTTVMFGKVYFPSRRWREAVGPYQIYATLRHEAVHLRDARRFPVFFQFSYLFLLPSILSFRALWEWRGYLETMRVEAELRGCIDDLLLDHIERRFTGPDYLFMWPFPRSLRRRLRTARARLLRECGVADSGDGE